MERTLKQQLAESMYTGDTPLATVVADMLADGQSYREIADTVNEDMPGSFNISREAIRRWYGQVNA